MTEDLVCNFILEAVREKTPVVEAYAKLRRLHPVQEICYVDFERFYYLFNQGMEPTDVNEARRLNLYDLPIHLLEKVTCELPPVDYLVLRKVSKGLRSLVDSTAHHCKVVHFGIEEDSWTIKLDDLQLGYVAMENGSCSVIANRNDIQDYKLYSDDRNFREVMLTDVTTFLRMPKLEIDVIATGDGAAVWSDFVQLLKSLEIRLNVEAVWSDNLGLLQSVHELTKPEKLEEIFIDGFDHVSEFIEAAENNLEILKHPKLKIGNLVLDNYSDESEAKFLEILKAINSQPSIHAINVADRRWIPSMLQSLNPERLEFFILDHNAWPTLEEFHRIAANDQWKTKTAFSWCHLPEEIDLAELVDFKWIESGEFNLIEENLIEIRDILLKSPHVEYLNFRSHAVIEHLEVEVDGQQQLNNAGDEAIIEERMRILNENIDRVMCQDQSYDSTTRRFSIPNSLEYFQLEYGTWQGQLDLTIQKKTPE